MNENGSFPKGYVLWVCPNVISRVYDGLLRVWARGRAIGGAEWYQSIRASATSPTSQCSYSNDGGSVQSATTHSLPFDFLTITRNTFNFHSPYQMELVGPSLKSLRIYQAS